MTSGWRSLSIDDLRAMAAQPEPEPELSECEPLEAICRTLHALECQLRPMRHDRGECYPYIPFPCDEFVEALKPCGSAAGRQLLDVGVGIGTKALLARHLGWKVAGIDIHQPYLDVAAKLLPGAPLWLSDAADFDSYDRFDAVYCWHPMVSDDAQDKLNRLIVERMRPGAFLVLPMWEFRGVPGAEKVSGLVWEVT